MKLNEKQLQVMRAVRDMMYADLQPCNGERPYVSVHICSNIGIVIDRRSSLFKGNPEVAEEYQTMKKELKDAINLGISGYVTFSTWLCDQANRRYKWSAFQRDQFYTLGRLAWLDRIIETGEILPDPYQTPMELLSA